MNDFLQNEMGLSNTCLGPSKNNLRGYDNKNNDCGNWQWDENNLISSAGAISSTAGDLLEYAKINIKKINLICLNAIKNMEREQRSMIWALDGGF
jgi:hypothetical protein